MNALSVVRSWSEVRVVIGDNGSARLGSVRTALTLFCRTIMAFALAWLGWCCISFGTSFPLNLRTVGNVHHALSYNDEQEGGGALPHPKKLEPSTDLTKHEVLPEHHHQADLGDTSRRSVIISSIGLVVSAVAPPFVLPAAASIPEIDATGNLFTPKADMLKGGSAAARGIPLANSSIQRTAELQASIYETRFVTYLARFLLNYEPSARAYWTSQGYGLSWDSTSFNNDNDQVLFAAFAESVEVGLADYFSGPFGSYSSVSAAIAGLTATQAAPAQQTRVEGLIGNRRRTLPRYLSFFDRSPPKASTLSAVSKAKQGILNLYSLLKARYNSIPAKRQLAILFAMISDPRLQPISEIQQLLGEVDNCLVSFINFDKTVPVQSNAPLLGKESTLTPDGETGFRYYSKSEVPQVRIDPPPPLGDAYCPAKAEPIMKCTGRVLRITVTDGGEGYISDDQDLPMVTLVTGRAVTKAAKATAILNRYGQIESIIVLNPGEGYHRPPVVRIESPAGLAHGRGRVAKAYAELEYAITRLSVTDPGNGYISTEPPEINIEPPRNGPGEWVVFDSMEPRSAVPNLVFPGGSPVEPSTANELSTEIISRIQRDPLELLPSAVRPERIFRDSVFCYAVPSLENSMFADPQANKALYRAFDPIFGGVGRIPVTVKASALTASEYGRLALSGAVCTVVVRTLLNPLELTKTKQQLNSDIDLLAFATERAANQQATKDMTLADSVTQVQRIGTIDLIKAMIDLRGFKSLFQSSDVTFLASLVFGSFGFGATELFRRSFAELSDGTGSEITLLLAASAATVLTAAAASPFEVLRVRSMGLIENKPWLDVLKDFLVSQLLDRTTNSIIFYSGPEFWKKRETRSFVR